MNPNLRILIVDDDQRMTHTLADIPSLAGHQAVEAASGAQGATRGGLTRGSARTDGCAFARHERCGILPLTTAVPARTALSRCNSSSARGSTGFFYFNSVDSLIFNSVDSLIFNSVDSLIDKLL